MSFKQNLLGKLKIKALSQRVLATVGPVGSPLKVDKEAMDRLLNSARYTKKRERELDLYCKETAAGKSRILVLDNDLNIYHTTMDDVLLRKNPTVKEMISIRNAIKILNDKDVVVSKKKESVQTIEKEAIDFLDLTFELSDLEEIEKEGIIALETGNTDGVIVPPEYGPIFIYSRQDNVLKFVDDVIEIHDKGKIDFLRQVVMGREKADFEGAGVFEVLKKAVMAVSPEM
ncbi:MAG: hypothetical protein JRI61_00075 [Deltaproteobacteria bacterium]|nr:hypothetical protein [Deltaproteobacteria bacterium]